MVIKLRAYYLPKEIRGLEDEFTYREINLDRYQIIFPVLKKEHILKVAKYVKERAVDVYSKSNNKDIGDIIQRLRDKWLDEGYRGHKIAMDVLPKLTGLSKEIILFYQFGTIMKFSKEAVEFLEKLNLPKEVLNQFVLLKDAGVWLRGITSFVNKLKFKKALKRLKRPKLVTFITPSNVPGLIEALGVFLALVGRMGMIIKTPTKQPVFGPLFAESLEELDSDLSSTIAVLPWKGGDRDIEMVLFKESDAVSIIGSTESANSVKERIDSLRNEGYKIKGCYHGGKFGLNIISKEFVNRDVAALSVIDGIGYEGYMCSSPAFGFFVEDRGDGSARKFAELMFEEAELISRIIPQSDLFKRYRKRALDNYLALESTGKVEVLIPKENNFAVVYVKEPKLIPDGQNRLFKVYPIKDINGIINLLKPWREYLQTVGVAIPTKHVFSLANKLGKIGVSNIRVVGTVTLPRLGESWDGYYPLLEFMLEEEYVDWLSINAMNIESEIKKLSSKLKELRNGHLLISW